MDRNSNNKPHDRIAAALVTLATALLTITVLLLVKVVSPASSILPPADAQQQEIFFTDIEYREIPFRPTPTVDKRPANSSSAETSGTDMKDNGIADNVSTPMLTAKEESPAKQDSAAAPAEVPAIQEPDPNELIAAAIRNKVGNAMKSKADEGQGTSSEGTAKTGNNPGKKDGLGLDGRRRLNEPKPSIKNVTGRVAVRITVNADGVVTAASVTGSTGFGTMEEEVRQACVDASKALRYSPDAAKRVQRGTITWNIQ